MKRRIWILVPVAVLAGWAWAQSQRSLIINGRTASTDVRVINGRAYAPIADMARALDLVVTPRGNNFELTRAGGANAVSGLTGKVGDWLFDGGWRLRVDRVIETQGYDVRFPYYGEERYDAEEGTQLIVVQFSYRNGSRTPQSFNPEAFLASTSGTSIPARELDLDTDGARNFSKALLPGAEGSGAFIFRVDGNFQMKDLVVVMGELTGYDDAVRPKERSAFRISLRP